MKNETQHTTQSPALPFFARYLEQVRTVQTVAKAGVGPKIPPYA